MSDKSERASDKANKGNLARPDLIGRKIIREDGEAAYYGQDGRPVQTPQTYALSSRTVAEREADLSFIENLFLRGYTFSDITEKLIEYRHSQGLENYTISKEMVILDSKEIMLRWQTSALKDAGAWFDKEMLSLDKLEAEYWDAWERSKARARFVETQRVEYGDQPMNPNEASIPEETLEAVDEYLEQDAHGKRRKKRQVPPRTIVSVTDNPMDGNPVYLQGIERVIAIKLKMLGIGQTSNVNINWKREAEKTGVDPDALMDKMVEGFLKEGEKK